MPPALAAFPTKLVSAAGGTPPLDAACAGCRDVLGRCWRVSFLRLWSARRSRRAFWARTVPTPLTGRVYATLLSTGVWVQAHPRNHLRLCPLLGHLTASAGGRAGAPPHLLPSSSAFFPCAPACPALRPSCTVIVVQSGGCQPVLPPPPPALRLTTAGTGVIRPIEAAAEPLPRDRLGCGAHRYPLLKAMPTTGRGGAAPLSATAATDTGTDRHPPSPPLRSHPARRSAVRLRRAAVVVVTAAAAVVATAAKVSGQPSRLDDVFGASAERVVRIADAARNALEPPNACTLDKALSSCGCSYSPCAARYPDSLTCGSEFSPNSQVCGGDSCGESKSDWANSFVLPGRGQISPDGTVSTAVAKDVCLTKALDRSVFRSLSPAKQITYFATSNGAFRYHPGRSQSVAESYDQCGGPFEARLRPWYSAASSGPKDVVIAVDASAGMTQSVAEGGTTSRWTLASSAVADLLDTLNPRDFVAIVRSDGGSNGALTVGNTGPLMESVSEERVTELKKAVEAIRPAGTLNVAATMRFAFGLLQRSAEASVERSGLASAGCSRVVIWITGGRDACYSRPACQSAATGGCTCTADVLSQMNSLQSSLSAVGGGGLPKAMVTTMTVGDLVDDSLARQMACSSSGTWARVTSQDVSSENSLRSTDVTGYYRMLSVARWVPGINVSQVVFSRLYDGAGDMGDMTTATIPVFSRFSKRVIGVAGADIPIADLLAAAPGATREDLVDEIRTRAPQCERGDLSTNIRPCDAQQLRGPEAACVPARPPPSVKCFKHAGDLYVAQPEVSTWRSWDAANTYCGTLGPGGMLAPIRSIELSQLLTQLSGLDGSWVGVRRGKGSSAAGEWVSPTGAPVRFNSWTVESRLEECVAIDRRGLEGNWFARKCDKQLPFICWLPDAAAITPPPTVCGAGEVVDLDAPQPNRSNPLTATGECSLEEAVRSCRGAQLAVNNKPFCPLGLESGNIACDNHCCDGCQCLALGSVPGKRIGAGAVIGIVVGVLVVILFVSLGFVVWRRRAEARRGVIDDASDDDEYYVMRQSEEKSEKNYAWDGDGSVDMGGGGGRAIERGGHHPTDAEAAYHGRQLEQATQPGEGVGARVWSWSPGTFFAPRRPTQ